MHGGQSAETGSARRTIAAAYRPGPLHTQGSRGGLLVSGKKQ